MNILFLTIAWPEENESNIYTDLMKEFQDAGHSTYIVAARERRSGKSTKVTIENGMHVLRVKSGNITQTNYFEKGISSIFLGYQMRMAIKRYYKDLRFDLIVYSTPPITIANAVKKLKGYHNANTYLLLKDIWPHDIAGSGVIKKGGLIWHYFRQKEKLIYRVSDYIGCMSPANIQYILEHNTYLNPERVEECPNSIIPTVQKKINRAGIREKHGIPDTSTVFIFGGNLGKPQGVNFLLDAACQMTDNEKVFFLIIGSGTEYSKIKNRIEKESISNVLLLERLPKEEYEDMVRASDVGLILLDRYSVIPNFPSRLLSYLDVGLPVLCSTDDVCDMGDIVEEWNCGIKTLHGDLDSFTIAVNKLASNKSLRMNMSKHSRELLEKKYTAKQGYKTIMKHFE